MPLTLDSWSLDGSQLIEAITLDQARTSGTELVLTTAIVEELRLAHWSKVRDTIEGTRVCKTHPTYSSSDFKWSNHIAGARS